MEPCFSKLSSKSTIRKELLEFCQKDSEWIDPKVGTFFQKNPSQNLIFKDPLLKIICENYLTDHGFDVDVKIFMIKPWTHYMLHSDQFRSASINLLINDHSNSISYFKTSEPYNKMHINIVELEYEQDCYYLFNSKIPHAVTNRDQTRFLLSITVKHDYYTMLRNLKNQFL